MRGELFRIIEDYPNYEVSTLGRVRNGITGRFLTLVRNPTNGWYFVNLSRDGQQRTMSVHRLVAEAFLYEPKDPNTSIIQRDGDRSNNNVDNLVWKPRWFAVMYMREINYPRYHTRAELISERTGEVFDSVAHVASVVLHLPSFVFAGIYGRDTASYPGYGYIAPRDLLFSYTQVFRGL